MIVIELSVCLYVNPSFYLPLDRSLGLPLYLQSPSDNEVATSGVYVSIDNVVRLSQQAVGNRFI